MDKLPTPPQDVVGTYEISNSLGWLMRLALTSISQTVEKKMEDSGLTNAQWKPMLRLYMGDAQTVAELARCCFQDAGGMTRLLDRLESKGLCQRQRSETDRRIVNIALTEEGHAVAQHIPDQLQEVQDLALTGFTPEEIVQFKSYLRRVTATLQTQETE
jgi:DNA-binding MarR family transcriptional regulator